MTDRDTTETIVEDKTTIPQILDSSCSLRTTNPTYVPFYDYEGYVRHATKMLKLIFKDDYPITRNIHHSKSQNTFVLKGIDHQGNGHVIKALVLPLHLSYSELEQKKQNFTRECDLIEGFYKILRGKGVAQVTGCGVKYPAKLKDFMDEIRMGVLPLTVPYFATAHLGGGDLEKVVRHQFPIKKTITVFRQLAETVSFMHDFYNILHKDLKPSNIIFDLFDNPHLIDLGIVETIGTKNRRTEAGSTPYMSPDQAKGFMALMHGGALPVHTHRTDMYSFGMLLGDMIHKYNPRNPVEIWDQYFETEEDFIAYIANDPQITFPSSGIQELDDIIHRTISNNKKDQFKSMKSVYEELCKLECRL